MTVLREKLFIAEIRRKLSVFLFCGRFPDKYLFSVGKSWFSTQTPSEEVGMKIEITEKFEMGLIFTLSLSNYSSNPDHIKIETTSISDPDSVSDYQSGI